MSDQQENRNNTNNTNANQNQEQNPTLYDNQDTSKFAVLDEKYFLYKKVGSGATCKVKLGYIINSGKRVAVKILKSQTGPNGQTQTSKHYFDEINMLKKITHRNVISLIDGNKGIIKKPNSNSLKQVDYIVFEYAQNGELFDFLYFPRKGLGEYFARNLFKQICEGLESCHVSGVVHRDLKTENIMMDESWVLKIADFGYATMLMGRKGDGVLKTHLGTVSYAAPEILAHKDYNGACADIFSCGVILFVLVTGKLPFGKAHVTDPMYKLIAKCDYENYWKVMQTKIAATSASEEFKSLLNLILAYEPLQRPSISEIKNHPWMLQNCANDEELKKELESRKLIVQNLKAIEAAEEKRQKLLAQQSNKNKNVVYRSKGANETEAGLLQNLEFFKDKRAIKDYGSENTMEANAEDMFANNPYKIAIEGELDYIEFLNELCRSFLMLERSKSEKPEIEVNATDCKFTVAFELSEDIKKDLGEISVECLKIAVQVQKVENNWYMVFFEMLGGDKLAFSEVYDEIVIKYAKANGSKADFSVAV